MNISQFARSKLLIILSNTKHWSLIDYNYYLFKKTQAPSISVTSPGSTVNNNFQQATQPPPTQNGKPLQNIMGPSSKKDRRQLSSRFNVNKQNCEIEALPPVKGELMLSAFVSDIRLQVGFKTNQNHSPRYFSMSILNLQHHRKLSFLLFSAIWVVRYA